MRSECLCCQNMVVESEDIEIIPEVNSPLKQNGLGLVQPASSTERIGDPQRLIERSPLGCLAEIKQENNWLVWLM